MAILDLLRAGPLRGSRWGSRAQLGRGAVGLSLALTTSVSYLEAAVGLALDGRVHHESPVEAFLHAQARRGPEPGHGHEDGPAPPGSVGAGQEDPGRSRGDALPPGSGDDGTHRHGTAADHCTHIHAPAVLAAAGSLPAPGVRRTPRREPALRLRWIPRLPSHPPRA